MSESKATVSGTINFFVYTNVPEVDDERICPVCTEEAPSGDNHMKARSFATTFFNFNGLTRSFEP